MKIESAYITVSDRKRAETFLQQVFQLEPCMSNGSFTFFDVDGFLFGLFDPAATSESIQIEDSEGNVVEFYSGAEYG